MPGRPHLAGAAALTVVLLSPGPMCLAEPPGFDRDTRAYNLAHGRVVFTEKCLRCHESGRKGAPVLDDADDWSTRLEQPLDTLIEHAQTGHGRMPARGDQAINDQDLAAAVAYVVNHARVLTARTHGTSPAPVSEAAATSENDPLDQAVVRMLMMLVGKERWK